MRPARVLALASTAAVAVTSSAGCGLGPGAETEGDATLTVTRDYGAERLLGASSSDPPASETVMRFLDREAEIETRYGGGFVEAIEGVEGTLTGDGRSLDWFFYVNGIESPAGAADVKVEGGDRIWWDYRDWTEAMRVPAVVGSWPEPFLQASAGSDRVAVRVVCAGDRDPCESAQDALADAGVSAVIDELGREEEGTARRLIVGEWSDIGDATVPSLIARGPRASGVFARIDEGRIDLLRATGEESAGASGLVAATRDGEGPPTWVATGTDAEGVADAVALLDDDFLRDRYAVGVMDGEPVAVPVPEGAP
jgi:hypothetical protein